jgi:hypothetical protein
MNNQLLVPLNTEIVSEEEAIVDRLVFIIHCNMYYTKFHGKKIQNQKHFIKLMAIELEPYLPETRDLFDSEKNYIYRLWIRRNLISRVTDREKLKILTVTDPIQIKNLDPESKKTRNKFSNEVSDILRKIKNYVYLPYLHHKKCTICSKDIHNLLTQCLHCKNYFHVHCISGQSLICTYCGVDLK